MSTLSEGGQRRSARLSEQRNNTRMVYDDDGLLSVKRKAKKSDPIEPTKIADLVAQRKKRLKREERKDRINELLADLGSDPIYNNEEELEKFLAHDVEKELAKTKKSSRTSLDDADALSSEESENDELDLEQLGDIKTSFMQEEGAEKIKQLLETSTGDDDNDKKAHYTFFRKRCKIPDPILLEDNSLPQDNLTREKEEFIYNLSQTSEGRKFLLASGSLQHWFRRGWECPHYMYQWLFELVAFEADLVVAKHAYETISFLWTNLGDQPPPFYAKDASSSDGPHVRSYQNRYIEIDTFTHVLVSYGAVVSEMTWDTRGELGAKTIMSEEWSQESEEDRRIPLSQFALVLRLFEFSLRTWPKAYNRENLRFLCKIFLQMCVDRVSIVLILDIQKVVESCLSAMDEEHWEEDISSISEQICKRLDNLQLQTHLLKAAKPTYSRCLHLRRILAMTALEFAQRNNDTNMEHDTQESSAAHMEGDGTPSSSSSYFTARTDIIDGDAEQQPAPSSSNGNESKTENGTTLHQSFEPPSPPPTCQPMSREPSLMSLSSDTPAHQSKILVRLLEIVSDRDSIFQRREIDYLELTHQVLLLDAAVGADEAELTENAKTLRKIIKQLQLLNRRVGGQAGILDRQKANEAVQRIWNRLAYIVDRDGAVLEEHQV